MQPNANELTLTFTVDQLAVINEGLMFIAFGRAAPVVKSINDQLVKLAPAQPQEIDKLLVNKS